MAFHWDNWATSAKTRSFTGESDEIITALSRTTWLFVIARNSSVTYKGQAINARQVARRPAPSRPAVAILGVRFGSTAVDFTVECEWLRRVWIADLRRSWVNSLRRCTKEIPHAFGERPVLRLVYAALITALIEVNLRRN